VIYLKKLLIKKLFIYLNSILNYTCFISPSLDFPHYDFSEVLAVSVAT